MKSDPISFIAENQGSILDDLTMDFPSYAIAGIGLAEFSGGIANYPIIITKASDYLSEVNDDKYHESLSHQIFDAVSSLRLDGSYDSEIPSIIVFLNNDDMNAAIILSAATANGRLEQDDIGFSDETLRRKIRNYIDGILQGEMVVTKIVGHLY